MIPDNTADTLAAIDLGSNSFHMIVARLDGAGTLSVIDKMRESVRLGGGLDEAGKIDPLTWQRALDCLERFGQRVRHLPAGSVRVVGTNTLRVAKNAKSFVREAARVLGHPIDIISGQEEARIIFLGVAHGRAAREGRRLVVDIGGGSTEMIVGSGAKSEIRESIHMGCVSATRAFFADGKITTKRMRKAETEARLAMLPYVHEFRARDWQESVGCSGTIKAIRNIAQAEGWCESGLTLSALHRMRDLIVEQGQVSKLKMKELKDERAEVLPGGLAVLIAVFEALGIDVMRVSDMALREGLLYDLVGRIKRKDVRDATVASILTRWSLDQSHGQAVAATAEHLFDQVAKVWQLGEERRRMLRWASLLHEIGLQVSHNNHHKHGAYILEHADLPGFSRPEQALLARLVLNHRRKFRLESFAELVETAQLPGQRLAVLLRLAVLVHRGRPKEEGPLLTLVSKDQQLRLTFPAGWLAAHPLTHADLDKEQQYLSAAGLNLQVE
jgi:exopolyphosphatase/guanosine-5'-triphosphate,3'-diphosphate pyrophosphatase